MTHHKSIASVSPRSLFRIRVTENGVFGVSVHLSITLSDESHDMKPVGKYQNLI